MSVVATDLLLCNITQAFLMEQQQQPYGSDGNCDDDSSPPKPDSVASPQAKEALFVKFSQPLLPVVLKALRKILNLSHAYVINSDNDQPVRPLVSSAPSGDLESFLAIAGKNPLVAKDTKPLFQTLFTEDTRARIAKWNGAATVDNELKVKLWSLSGDHMLPFLSSHFASICGGQVPFDQTASLKSALSSAFRLLWVMLELSPLRCGGFAGDLAAVMCSGVLEFVQPELAKFGAMCGPRAFSDAFTSHQMVSCFQLAAAGTKQDHGSLGVVLGDVFLWLGSMLESPEITWPSQGEFDSPIGEAMDVHTLYKSECAQEHQPTCCGRNVGMVNGKWDNCVIFYRVCCFFL